MMMSTAWALCDQVAAAIGDAYPSWTVIVTTDPTTDISTLPVTGIELAIGPYINEEGFIESSRRVIASDLTIAMRMRSLMTSKSDVEARAKCAEWDKAVKILQRQEGWDLGASLGHFKWQKGFAGVDINALRKDRVIAIVATEISMSSIRPNPKAGA